MNNQKQVIITAHRALSGWAGAPFPLKGRKYKAGLGTSYCFYPFFSFFFSVAMLVMKMTSNLQAPAASFSALQAPPPALGLVRLLRPDWLVVPTLNQMIGPSGSRSRHLSECLGNGEAAAWLTLELTHTYSGIKRKRKEIRSGWYMTAG